MSGDARYRWQSIQAAPNELSTLMGRFPDHDPERVFEGHLCARMTFRGGRAEVEISREAGIQRRLFRRKNFWDEVLTVISSLGPRCEQYSYSDKADVFVATLTPEARGAIRALSGLLRFTLLESRIRTLDANVVVLCVRRA